MLLTDANTIVSFDKEIVDLNRKMKETLGCGIEADPHFSVLVIEAKNIVASYEAEKIALDSNTKNL